MQTLIMLIGCGFRYDMSYWSEHTQYYLEQFERVMKELNKEHFKLLSLETEKYLKYIN